MPGSGYSIFNMTMRKRKQFKKLITEIRKYQAYGDYTLTDEQQLAVVKVRPTKGTFMKKVPETSQSIMVSSKWGT